MDKILESLHKLTYTTLENHVDPQSSPYFQNRAGNNLLQLLHSKVISADLLTSEQLYICDQTVVFLLDLIKTPDNLKGSLASEKCVFHLLDVAFKSIDLAQNEHRLITAITSNWFNVLHAAPLSALYLRKPHFDESLFTAMHLELWKHSIPSDGNTPSLYFAYGFFFHQTLRRQLVKENTMHDYVRAVRYLFECMPDDIKMIPTAQHPHRMPIEYVRRAFDFYRRSKQRPDSDQGDRYENIIKFLLRFGVAKPKRSSPRGDQADHDDMQPPDGVVRTGISDFHNVHNIELMDIVNDEELDDNFESPVAHDAVILDGHQITSSHRPYLNTALGSHIKTLRLNLPFSPHLDVFHLSLIYSAMFRIWNHDFGPGTTHYIKSVWTFIMILIHTGIDYFSLLDMVHDKSLNDAELCLEKDAGRYYLCQRSFLKRNLPQHNPRCHRADIIVRIPMPGPICRMLAEIDSDSGFVFSYLSGRLRHQLTVDDIQRFLEKEVNTSPDGFGFKLNIRLTHFKWGFRYHYERQGLSSTICSYISGKDVLNSASTRAHYMNIKHEKLAFSYLTAFHSLHQSIIDNMKQAAASRYIQFWDGNIPSIFLSSEGPDVSSSDFTEVGYGSPAVPKEEEVRDLISKLLVALTNEKTTYDRHNLYTIYVVIALQLATGLRPRNKPDIRACHFDDVCGTITISDKQSASYFESRTLPLPSVLNDLLRSLISGSSRLINSIARTSPAILFDTREHPLFFFLVNGKFDNFMLRDMKSFLYKYDLFLKLPDNFARQFLRNELYLKGIFDDAADIFLGHQRGGKEMLGVASSTVPSAGCEWGFEVICAMLERIGVKYASYE
jgi:integrase